MRGDFAIDDYLKPYQCLYPTLGASKVGRRRARCLTARFSTPPVAAAPKTFTSCSYRTEFLFCLRLMTGELVEDLKIRDLCRWHY
jgi:hypothetical protein